MNRIKSNELTAISEATLREQIPLDLNLIEVIEKALSLLDDQEVVIPKIMHMAIPSLNAEVDVKTAYIPGIDNFAVKISTGFFNNPQLNLPSLSGLMVLIDSHTGSTRAILHDNSYLTDIRTAAAGAVAARYGASPQCQKATIVGTGLQAELQTQALLLVHSQLKEIEVWGRDFKKAQICAQRIQEKNRSIEVKAIENLKRSLMRSNIVVTTTSACTPVITRDMIHPGLHITAMGSDAPYKNEIDPEILSEKNILYVPDKLSQTEVLGELRVAKEKNISPPQIIPLSEIIKKKRHRASDEEITIFDLTGTGVQDSAIADYVMKKLKID